MPKLFIRTTEQEFGFLCIPILFILFLSLQLLCKVVEPTALWMRKTASSHFSNLPKINNITNSNAKV